MKKPLVRKEFNGGLIVNKRKLRDPRNFSRSKTFGASINLASIPTDFDLQPDAKVLNQLSSTHCTAFANSMVSSIQEGVELSPEYAIQKTKLLMGGDPHRWGADPDMALKAHVKFGCIQQSDNPWKLSEWGSFFVEDPANWKARGELDFKAIPFQKKSYMKVDGYGNLFDSIRATMWESYQAYKAYGVSSKKRAVSLGMMWQPEWTYCANGIIPKISGFNTDLAHNVLVRGTKLINGEIYLIIQNSWGDGIGDKGLFYFPKEVINSKYVLFAKTFEDKDPSEVKAEQWGIMAQLYNLLMKLAKNFNLA